MKTMANERTSDEPGDHTTQAVSERTIEDGVDHATHGTHGSVERVALRLLDQEQIRLRAWWIWQERGGGHGGDVDDWLKAEIELGTLPEKEAE